MLNPNQNRLDYGRLLSPPAGFCLDFAVGTTYSLDLDALVGACLALGLSEETDSVLMQNPICLLEALRSTGDKVALFCEGGQIHLPTKVTSLYVLLEKIVFPISTGKRRGLGRYPSFHSKFWLLRFVNDKKEVLYRFAVLSRNLTFDRSWDVSFCMEGRLTEEPGEKNAPLCDFLFYLSGFAGEKRLTMHRLRRELPFVRFSLDSKEFYDYDFIPSGIKAADGSYHSICKYPLFTDSFHELLIMSPFLSGSVIRDFNERKSRIEQSKCVLFTRAMSLPRLKPSDCDHFKLYTLKDAIVDGETMISGEDTVPRQQDIHAKVYMVRKYADTDLYLGSLNASHNALYGNIEFMIRLRSKNRYLNLDKLTQQLFCGKEEDVTNPFQTVDLSTRPEETPPEDPRNLLDGIVKELNRSKPHARVLLCGTCYEIHMHIKGFQTDCLVQISPLLAGSPVDLAEEMVFPGLRLEQLSEFYQVTVSDGQNTTVRVLKIPTEGIPEGRERAIFSGVISDKSRFCQYIAFLLGDELMISFLEGSEASESGTSSQGKSFRLPSLYEKMLQTAASNPGKLKEIDQLLRYLSDDSIVPKHFHEMYQTFRKAVKLRD